MSVVEHRKYHDVCEMKSGCRVPRGRVEWLMCFQGVFFVCVYTGMPESLLYCSLHDPVSPCPAGYVTNKVCSQKDLHGCNFVQESQPTVFFRG